MDHIEWCYTKLEILRLIAEKLSFPKIVHNDKAVKSQIYHVARKLPLAVLNKKIS